MQMLEIEVELHVVCITLITSIIVKIRQMIENRKRRKRFEVMQLNSAMELYDNMPS